ELILFHQYSRLGSQDFSTVMTALMENHPQECEIVTPRRNEAAATGEEFACRPIECDWFQTTVGSTVVHANKARSLVRRGGKRRVCHPKRSKDVLTEIGVERAPRSGLDRPSRPVDVDAVLPTLSGIEHQRRTQRGQLAGKDRWLVG